MERDLLHYLLAAFPTDARRTAGASSPEKRDPDDHLVIRGYRLPFESPVDDMMLEVLAEFRKSGFSGDSVPGIDRG
jgi:hypothetical protein